MVASPRICLKSVWEGIQNTVLGEGCRFRVSIFCWHIDSPLAPRHGEGHHQRKARARTLKSRAQGRAPPAVHVHRMASLWLLIVYSTLRAQHKGSDSQRIREGAIELRKPIPSWEKDTVESREDKLCVQTGTVKVPGPSLLTPTVPGHPSGGGLGIPSPSSITFQA